MGKILIIKGADFSAVAVGKVDPILEVYSFKVGSLIPETGVDNPSATNRIVSQNAIPYSPSDRYKIYNQSSVSIGSYSIYYYKNSAFLGYKWVDENSANFNNIDPAVSEFAANATSIKIIIFPRDENHVFTSLEAGAVKMSKI